MAKQSKAAARRKEGGPRSVPLAKRGISTAAEFSAVMSALMGDLLEGRVDPRVGSAVCNAGGKLLKIVEMQYRYGKTVPGQSEKALQLTGEQR